MLSPSREAAGVHGRHAQTGHPSLPPYAASEVAPGPLALHAQARHCSLPCVGEGGGLGLFGPGLSVAGVERCRALVLLVAWKGALGEVPCLPPSVKGSLSLSLCTPCDGSDHESPRNGMIKKELLRA